MKKGLTIIFLLFSITYLFAQDSIVKNGYNKFFYSSGKISSEGLMKDGKPNGYWKTYYENGFLKSEGNRKNFELDSAWKFYSDSGTITLIINYQNGKKNGFRTTYLKNERIEEYFKNDIKDSTTCHFYKNGALKSKVKFKNGREEGQGIEYSPDGNIITLIDYKKGYIINTENINRKREGLKHGLWKTFYNNEKIKTEENYYYGKKDGYFKEFDKDGNLISIQKYENDILVEDAPELASYVVKTDYYKNGKVSIVQSYKDDIPHGIRQEYSPDGQITKSYIFRNGIITGLGIVDEKGMRQRAWTEFYETGEKEANGEYLNGKKTGLWKYYFRNGKTEQTGAYNTNGKPEGNWKWYYESGNLRKEDNFMKSKLNGQYIELSDSGKIIIKGEYVDGEEEGEWIYHVGDEKETGSYVAGKREGEWKHYFHNGELNFIGSYTEGNQNGDFITYYDNKKIKEKGKYIMGLKEGDWSLFNYDGTKIITIRYEDGIEKSYDGNKIDFYNE
jgi:uncharacterized protein